MQKCRSLTFTHPKKSKICCQFYTLHADSTYHLTTMARWSGRSPDQYHCRSIRNATYPFHSWVRGNTLQRIAPTRLCDNASAAPQRQSFQRQPLKRSILGYTTMRIKSSSFRSNYEHDIYNTNCFSVAEGCGGARKFQRYAPRNPRGLTLARKH